MKQLKIGYCPHMNATDTYKLGYGEYEIIKECGFDFVELSMAGINSMSENEFFDLTVKLKAVCLDTDVCCNFFPAWIKLTGKQVDFDLIRSYTELAVYRANFLGVKIIVLGSFESKNIPAYMSYDDGYKQFIKVLRFIADIAGNSDINIGIEPINREKSNLIVNMEEGLKLINDINYENIKLIADYYQMCKEEESIVNFRKIKDHLIHIHLATSKERMFPNHGDESEFRQLLDALNSIGYNGRISIEGNSSDIVKDSKDTIKMLRSFL